MLSMGRLLKMSCGQPLGGHPRTCANDTSRTGQGTLDKSRVSLIVPVPVPVYPLSA
jgi:hypothetical protein